MEDNARTIQVFCWILDVSCQSFSVSVTGKTVEDLKEAILAKKRNILPNAVVGSDDIFIWKVSIEDEGNLTSKKELRTDQFVDKDALNASRPLSKVFPSEPAEGTISIVVRARRVGDNDQRPAKRIRLVTPNPFNEKDMLVSVGDNIPLALKNTPLALKNTPLKPLAEVKDIIDQILEKYRPTIQMLVTNAGRRPLIPPWSPRTESSNEVDIAFKNKIERLSIPAVEGHPCLLLHELGSNTSAISQKQAKYMAGIFSFEHHTVLINTSGSGKTRLGLDGLCRNWGFYGIVNEVSGDNVIGSGDFSQLMTSLDNSLDYCLAKERGSDDDVAARHMHQKVHRRVLQFMLARFIFLNLLITEASKCEGGLRPSDHRLLWVLLQARPTDLLVWDAFTELAMALRVASAEDLEAQIKEEYLTLENQGILTSGNHPVTGEPTHQPLYCILDEIQATTTFRMGEYRSDNDKKTKRPLLRPIWKSITNVLPATKMRVILSGTAINETSLKNVLASFAFKRCVYSVKRDIGAFDDPDAQRQYIKSYLPDVTDEQLAARQDFLKRAWGWCRGRYRNTATLIESILVMGPNSPHKILNQFVKNLTNFWPADGEKWCNAKPDIEDSHLEKWDFHRMEPGQIEVLCDIIYGQTVYGSFSLNRFASKDDIKAFIEYGFARTRAGEDVIDEPIVIMAALKWLGENRHFSLLACLQREVGKHAPHKNGFEAYLAFYVRKFFEKPRRLDQVFTFRSDFAQRKDSDLSWQTEEFELVTVSMAPGTNNQNVSIVTPSSGPSSNVGFLARTNDDIINWISENEGLYSFCFATESAGPDLFFFLKSTAKSELLLVALQAKCYEVVKKETLVEGVHTVTPSFFWKTKSERVSNTPSVVASKFLNALMEIEPRITTVNAPYPVLRVFASWPGDAKLERTLVPKNSTGSKATKRQAQVEDVPDRDLHPLATLHKANFNSISNQLDESWFRDYTEKMVVEYLKDQLEDEKLKYDDDEEFEYGET